MFANIILCFLACALTYFYKKLGDNKLNKLIFHSKYFVYYFLLLLSAIIAIPFFLFRPRNIHNGNIYARCTKHLSKVFGLEWHLRNGEILSEDQGAVLVGNHQSSFDMLGVFTIWEVIGKLRCILKKEVIYTGIFALAVYLGGGIFIDRSNPKNAYKTLQVITKVMTKDKTKIWIYPEGTRNKDKKKLLPFKKGAFNMAVTAQVPIIPVVFSPYYFVDREKYILNKGHIIIQCLEPVPTVDLTLEDVPELTDRVHAIMSAAYEKLSNEVMGSLSQNNN